MRFGVNDRYLYLALFARTWKEWGKKSHAKWPSKVTRRDFGTLLTTGMVSCIAQGYSLQKNKTDLVWQETRNRRGSAIN